ncbi:MAG TPA: outer membrane beta-barrel domain-containing protein [Gammaproteobacteria bacterium]|nr:outer membrane beta-barrel domain-containing protein [Gammaproteobacteria bacterium]
MEGRLRILFLSRPVLGVVLLFLSTAAWSADKVASQAQVIQPQIERRVIDVDKIDTEDFEIGVFSGLLSTEDFGTNLVIGARAAYHVTEGIFFEAAYAKSNTTETSYERLSGGAPLLTDAQRELTYYNVSIGYNLLPGEAFLGEGWAFNTALYVIGGVGITSFADDDRFTVNFGAGYRFLATDWLAVHLDVRDHIFDIDLLGKAKTAHNLELTGGLTVFF